MLTQGVGLGVGVEPQTVPNSSPPAHTMGAPR